MSEVKRPSFGFLCVSINLTGGLLLLPKMLLREDFKTDSKFDRSMDTCRNYRIGELDGPSLRAQSA